MALATLSIDIEARMARFEQGINRANDQLNKLGKSATSAGQRIGEFFAGAFGANVAADALARVVDRFKEVTGSVLAIKDLAEATGSTVENISALDDVARRAGGTFEVVEGALVKFNASLKEADGKNGVSLALKAIGLDAAKLRDIDPAQALLQTAQALEQFADDGNKARIVQELFGKSVKEAAPFLRDLAEAGQLNAKVTAEQAEAVDQFDKNLARLRANSLDTARALAGPLVDAINEVFVRLQAGKDVFGSLSATLLAGATRKQFSDAAEGVAFYSTELAKLQQKQAAAAQSSNAFSRLFSTDGFSKDIEATQKLLQFYERVAIAQNKFAGGGRGFVNPDAAVPRAKLPFIDTGKTKEAKASFEDYDQALTKLVAGLIEKTDTVKFAEINAQFQKLQQLSAAGLDPKIVEQVQQLLQVDASKFGPPISEELARVNELLKATDSARLAAASRDAGLLRAELERTTAGTQRWLELTDALIDVETEIDKLAGALPELTQAADESAQQLRNTIEGALGSTLSTALRGEFKSIGDLWRNLLIDMASRAISADILGALFGNKGATSGNGATSSVILGAIFKLFGSANGNAFGPAGLIPFAGGGVVTGATPFTFGGGRLGVMGEAGPEAILPLKRGPGGRLGVVASGGGVVINQTVNVQSGASRNEVLQAATVAKNAAVAEIQDMMRRGRMMPAAG